ncbi:MAG: hypothetical protein RLZZ65_1650 [Bacteroidota bacterium]|jgi:hypothetical protein
MHKLLFLTICLFGILQAQAQSITAEPASFYGLGERSARGHGVYDALGKNSINVIDSGILNHTNPATYNRMSKGSTLYTLGLHSRQSWYQSGTASQFNATPMVEEFTLGFKIRKQMGLSFGLRPYSSRGYQISETVYTGLDSIKYNYTGKGAIQDLYLGYSLGIIERPKTKFAIGTNASFLFGTLVNQRSSTLLTGASAAGGIERNSLIVRSASYEFGTYFTQSLGKKHSIALAAVYQPQGVLKAELLQELYSSATVGTPSSFDTVSYAKNAFTANHSQNWQAGFAYSWKLPTYKRQTRELHPQLQILASYANYGALTQNSNLITGFDQRASQKMSIGIQFQPEFRVLENLATLKAFEKITYRMGYYQQTLPYLSNGNQYEEKGLTLGFGLPLLAQVSLSSLQVGLTLGQRSIPTTQWSEKFIGARVSLIMAPSNFEKWFRKRQLD